MHGSLISHLFFSWDEYGNQPQNRDHEKIKREYELIQAKKSKLSSAERKKVCKLYKTITK